MAGKWIKWTQWSDEGIVNFGQMPVADIGKYLKEFEAKAKELLESTVADHVLYGAKLYDGNGELKEVKFYMVAMDEERFVKDVASKSGMTVYALHKRK